MTKLLCRILGLLVTLLVAAQAHAYEAGWMQIQVAGTAPDAPMTTVALYYPTMAAPRTITMGPFMLDVAIGGKPVDKVKALILLSHGIGGSELGHSVLAQALARNGYLVAALRHPGDNWQDRSLIEKSPERYFDERPRQASRVIDAILADPAWKDRIATERQGPRVGALGHSAGGYTVLALVGARPDLSRVKQHCLADVAEDPIFCSMGRSGDATLPPAAAALSLKDERIRAIVAMAPTGVPLTAASLATVRAATMIYEAELDRFLVPRFHAEWVASNLPAPNLHRVPNAWHFAFMDTPNRFVPSPDGDIAANPPGFDRDVFLKQLAVEITAFFDSRQKWALALPTVELLSNFFEVTWFERLLRLSVHIIFLLANQNKLSIGLLAPCQEPAMEIDLGKHAGEVHCGI
ncbi:putative dienelactone hydrolase [Actimicrobium sp. GrIS 1.19]|nr:putative dienelactone hydrolase [Actimicrobium sp. GrIS 1.19]